MRAILYTKTVLFFRKHQSFTQTLAVHSPSQFNSELKGPKHEWAQHFDQANSWQWSHEVTKNEIHDVDLTILKLETRKVTLV